MEKQNTIRHCILREKHKKNNNQPTCACVRNTVVYGVVWNTRSHMYASIVVNKMKKKKKLN